VFLLNIVLAVFLLVMVGWTFYRIRAVHKQRELNNFITHNLTDLLAATKEEIAKNHGLIEQAKNLVRKSAAADLDDLLDNPLQSSEMLASVITVIVGKYGDMRLGLKDFAAISSNDFVSVYIDTQTQDVILSLKEDLVTKDSLTMANFTTSDDTTYH